MRTERYDIIIIGSGAGGGTMAHALADSPARILILERGDFVPQEAENWSPEAVWKHLRYQTKERWIDERGEEFRPYTHYNVGGNTKFWGSVLYRLRREDFQPLEHMEGSRLDGRSTTTCLRPSTSAPSVCITSRRTCTDRLNPSAARFHTRRFLTPKRCDDRRAVARARAAPVPLPLGIRDGCVLCIRVLVRVQGAREERSRRLLRAPRHRAAERRPVDQRVRAPADHEPGRRHGRGGGGRRQRRDGSVETSWLPCLRRGKLRGAAASIGKRQAPEGAREFVGARRAPLMAHLATMMQGFHPFRKNATVFQKTVAINDFYFHGPKTKYPLGQIQSQGRTHGVMAQTVGRRSAVGYEWWVARASTGWRCRRSVGCGNRVTLDSKGGFSCCTVQQPEGH